MNNWAARITELREQGLTLAQIGKRIGLTISSVCDIEQGRSSSPRGDAALRLYELHQTLCVKRRRSESRAV